MINGRIKLGIPTKLKDFDSLKNKVKPFLTQYLEEKGVVADKNGKFSCPLETHEDKEPSCGFVPASNNTVVHCFGCVLGDSKVMTPNGIKKVKDVIIGDKIASQNGFTLVKNIWVSRKEKKFIEFNFSKVRIPLRVTFDHKMLVIREKRCKYSTQVHMRNCFPEKCKMTTCSFLKKNNKYQLEEVFAKEVKRGDFVTVPALNRKEIRVWNIGKYLKNYRCGYRGKLIPATVKLTEDLGWFIGMYIAEGSTPSGGRVVRFSLARKEEAYADRLISIAKKVFNLTGSKFFRDDRASLEVSICNKQLADILANVCGSGARNKHIPYDLFLWDSNAIIEGIFDGDGSNREKWGNTKTIITISEELMWQIFFLQVTEGLGPSFSYFRGRRDKNGIYHKDSWKVQWTPGNIIQKSNYFKINNKNYYGIKIEEVAKITLPEQKVYDITTENETFGVDGIVVHNCSFSGDIFTLAHVLEKKPISGQRFVSDNLEYLLNKYNIPYESVELSEEELLTHELFRTFKDIEELIIEYQPIGNSSMYGRFMQERRWSVSLCQELGIGTVKNYPEFMEKLRARGYTLDYLKGLLGFRVEERLLDEEMVIFSIRNECGDPVGLATRNMKWAPGLGTRLVKYRNSRTSQIYQKSEILYGLDVAKNQPPPLIIFEGYGDRVTAYKYGIKNAVAVGGTAFTERHIAKLKSLGIRSVCICFDTDDSGVGKKKTEGIIDKYFSGQEDLNVKVIDLPHNYDPDSFLREKGLEGFHALPQLDAFEWRLKQFSYDVDSADLSAKMVPLIVNEPNNIKREVMCKQLADFTGVRVKAIQRELDALLNKEDAKRQKQIDDRIKQTLSELRYKHDNVVEVLESAAEDVRQIDSVYTTDTHSIQDVVTSLEQTKIAFENKKRGLLGWKSGFAKADHCFSGIRKDNFMYTIAGTPGSGKTSYVTQLALDLALNNEDIAVLYMSIDDSREEIFPRWVSLITDLDLMAIYHPREYLTQEHEWKLYEKGWKTLQKLIESENLSLKDSIHGTRLDYAEGWIRYTQETQPDKQIVFILDSFHKLTDEVGEQERIRFKHASSRVHRLVNTYKMAAICTMELRKLDSPRRPTYDDIGECVAGHTLLTDADTGSQIPIKDVKIGQRVLVMGCGEKLKASIVLRKFNQGNQVIYKLITKNGSEIQATTKHPFFTPLGWEHLRDLNVGSLVASSCKTSSKDKNFLRTWENSDFFWDQIVSIEKQGKEPVFDVEIEHYHNFIANGLVVHNSGQMSYDNKLIGLIYNDLNEKREKANIVWSDENDVDKNGLPTTKPVVEIAYPKNKISPFKGTLYYQLDTKKGRYREIDPSFGFEKEKQLELDKKDPQLKEAIFR